ncbi:MAG: Tex family protein [Eubacteriales bacterium]|nr:Tex family protein [Eubacteriales bacterium]
MDIIKKITEELKIKRSQTEAAVKLIDEGNTIPFIARYRKEATGSLNDEQLRELAEKLTYLRGLEEKKASVLASIEEQGKLTQELREQIEAAQTLVAVDDLYRPYRPKRKTRASMAREKGLQGLADYLLEQSAKEPVIREAARYVDPEKGVETPEEALAGARDIIAEQIADEAQYRSEIRDLTWKQGTITSAATKEAAAAEGAAGKKAASGAKSTGKADAEEAQTAGTPSKAAAKAAQAKTAERRGVYEMYFEFEEQIAKIPGYRVLALNRGEEEKCLSVKINAPREEILSYLGSQVIRREIVGGSGFSVRENEHTAPVLREVIEDSYDRLIAPAIERELRSQLTENAEDGAITVFRKNLEQLLMQPPIAGRTVLGWDPAFRTGCKLAVVDPTGKVLDTKVIYPTAPQNKVAEAKAELKKLIDKYDISLFSVGNGTASRESEQIIVDFFHELKKPMQYVIVNEAGASVYSASKLATEEFPNFDVGQRSAASIARRLQDPLAELVKIDPKSIGVGQYQHDMNQKKLGEALGGVVEDCVNRVGVDLNTASFSLLSYISGISATLAKNIVAYREENGRFTSRAQLKKVPKLGPKAFEQCAGFLRITGGTNPLDATSVHPESYPAVQSLLKELGISMDDPSVRMAGKLVADKKKTAERLGIGEITLTDILKELEKPARDPREDMPAPILRSDVLAMEDLTPGMKLKGTVRNIVDFGAFVDIGVHQDGLVHISRLSDRFIKSPLEVVRVGDVVDVTVVSVDAAKKRIALSMNGKM